MTGPATRRVGIIGGGVAGLMSAWELARAGLAVDLYEARNELGGLAASFDFDDLRIERFYHFICRGDRTLIDTCRRLGIGDRLRWRATRTGLYHQGVAYDFGTPLDLARFTPLPLADKLRFGVHILRARRMRDWQALRERAARDWLIAGAGQRAYDAVWDPLLRIKFDHYHTQLPAAWMWHRIHRVASSRPSAFHREKYGYLQGGSQTLVDAFAQQAVAAGARLRTGCGVEGIWVEDGRCRGVRVAGETLPYDYVVSAVPLPVYRALVPQDQPRYLAQLDAIPFLGVVCMILRLRESLSPYFWLNVNDPAIAFNGIIEYTNLNPDPRRDGGAIAYIPFYMDPDSPRYRLTDAQLFDEYLAALRRIRPGLARDAVEGYRVFRARHAQPAFRIGSGAAVPEQETPWPDLYLVESVQLYPADRIISGMLRLAQDVVLKILAREGLADRAPFAPRPAGEIPA
jgi:protoporphyrinogen oxidase